MTDKEAIEILSAYYEMDDDRQNVALDMAISALQAQDVPDTNVGDMISRQAAISELMEWVDEHKDNSFGGCLFHWTGIKAMLECLPSAQPEIVRCKDCKHVFRYRSEESAKKFGQIYECRRGVLNLPKLNDFCSKAERRNDEGKT